MTGNGSAIKPWKTLKEVIDYHLIETKNVLGGIINQGAPIKSGDKIILNSGYHGFIDIENAFNSSYIVVTAGSKQKPTLSGLKIASAKKWRFSKLSISPTFSTTGNPLPASTIVDIGKIYYLNRETSGKSSYIDIIDSDIYSFNEIPETLSATDWLSKVRKAVVLGEYATNVNIVNNYIHNNDFGIIIQSSGSRIQGNVITDFSGDGIRVSVKNTLIEDNVIKNNYHVDDNHCDAIQGYSGDPLNNLNNISMIGNIILNRDKKPNLYSYSCQGIGFFDGPMLSVKALDNIVMMFSGHGISLYDLKNGQITNNIVFTPAKMSDVTNVASHIRLGSKDRGGNIDNIVTNNISHSYSIISIGLISSGNIEIAQGTGKNLFINRLTSRLEAINTKYGQYHPVTGNVRVDSNFISSKVDSIF